MIFDQIPEWSPETKFEISGEQFNNLSKVYGELHMIMNQIFEQNLNLGNITIKYVDSEGKEVSKEQVEEMLQNVTKE